MSGAKDDRREPSRGRYFEEFQVGWEFTTGSHRITAEEITAFAELTGDDNPLHVDRDAARSAGFADVIAHGFLVQSLAMGLIADTGVMRGTTIALAGADLRFVAPAIAGTEISVHVRIASTRLSGRGRSGVLERGVTVIDAGGSPLVTGTLVNVMRLAPTSEVAS